MFEYRATVLRVVDGDTVDLLIDLGFSISYTHSCRLFGINAPEHGTPEGDAATAFHAKLLPAGAPVVVRTQKDKFEKYGRILGTVFLAKKDAPQGTSINDQLVAAGCAKPWDGRGARPV